MKTREYRWKLEWEVGIRQEVRRGRGNGSRWEDGRGAIVRSQKWKSGRWKDRIIIWPTGYEPSFMAEKSVQRPRRNRIGFHHYPSQPSSITYELSLIHYPTIVHDPYCSIPTILLAYLFSLNNSKKICRLVLLTFFFLFGQPSLNPNPDSLMGMKMLVS